MAEGAHSEGGRESKKVHVGPVQKREQSTSADDIATELKELFAKASHKIWSRDPSSYHRKHPERKFVLLFEAVQKHGNICFQYSTFVFVFEALEERGRWARRRKRRLTCVLLCIHVSVPTHQHATQYTTGEIEKAIPATAQKGYVGVKFLFPRMYIFVIVINRKGIVIAVDGHSGSSNHRKAELNMRFGVNLCLTQVSHKWG